MALVVAFSPVGLMRPSRLAWVLPEASLVVASALPMSCFAFAPASAAAVEEASFFGAATLLVSFCPVGLILPSRFDSVFPLASFVAVSAAPAALTSARVAGAEGAEVWAAAKAAPVNAVATTAAIYAALPNAPAVVTTT